MKAIEIKCPVEACGRGVGELCKMVDLGKHPFMGRFHLDRVREASRLEREKNQDKRSLPKQEQQDIRKLLKSTNRVVLL